MTLQMDRPLHPTRLTLRIGPPSVFGGGPVDVRSVRSAMSMMEENGRRQFARRARGLQVVWPTVMASWTGLVLTITGEVDNG